MSDEEKYDSDDENELEDDDEDHITLKNVAVIIIDVGPTMFDKRRLLKICLLAVYQIMDGMLLKGYKRNISVCFLRDDDIVVTKLSDNIIDSVKKILELLHDSIENLAQKYERKEPPSLRFTLTECLKEFKRDLSVVNPYIVILTDDDDPLKQDETEKLNAIDIALSFKEINIKLIVLPLKENFNFEPLYKDLLKAVNNVPLENFEDITEQAYLTVDSLHEILDLIIRNDMRINRRNFTLYTSKTGNEITFSVQMRYLVNNKHLNRNANISRTTNNKIKQDIEDYTHIVPDKFEFSMVDGVVQFPKGLKMYWTMPYGFRLLRIVREKQSSIHYLQKRRFIMQNDMKIENDCQTIFNDLHSYCMLKNRHLYCALLLPGNKQRLNKVELSPGLFRGQPCFFGTFLTSKDQIVYIPENYNEDNEKDAKFDINEYNLMSDLMDKMCLKSYKPHQWRCLQTEKTAAYIKSQLLDRDVDQVEDSIPSDQNIQEKLGSTYTALQEFIGYGEVEPPPAKKSRKNE